MLVSVRKIFDTADHQEELYYGDVARTQPREGEKILVAVGNVAARMNPMICLVKEVIHDFDPSHELDLILYVEVT